MTTNYTITENPIFNSREVTFDTKPARAILDAMKALGMRWNHKKSCWYGFATERELINAILENGTGEDILGEETTPTVHTDGYLGGGAVYGSKSRQYLHGADLSKAIRDDLKSGGINNVSVRCKTYAGGQSITVTVIFQPEDLADPADFLRDFRIIAGQAWIQTGSDCIHVDHYFSATAEEQHAIRYAAAKYDYTKYATTAQTLNHYHMGNYTSVFSEVFMAKLSRIQAVIKAYHYDESNAMVDYFDTNFYYDIVTKPATDIQPEFPPELSDLYSTAAI